MITLARSSVSWQALVIAGPSDPLGSLYYLRDIKGWTETPPSSVDDVARGGVGSRVTPVTVGRRTVTVTGWCSSAAQRDALVAAFDDSTALDPGSLETADLTVTHAGRTLTADAQLTRADATPEAGWGVGYFGWAVQWTCPDPRLYGGRLTLTSPIGTPGTGVSSPNTSPLATPANPTGGRITVTNVGKAKAPAIYTLQGPITAPGIALNGGTDYQRLVQYEFPLAATERLVIDTAQGAAFLNGEWRGPLAGSARTSDLELRKGDNTVEALGQGDVGSPSITVSFRPAYWKG